MDGFTEDEVKCMDKLREKYQSSKSEPVQSDSTVHFPGSNLSVSLCHACQGSGYVKEEYNNRVLEKLCRACNGEGTFTQGGDPSARITAQNRIRSSESIVDRLERALKELDKCQKEREAARKILSTNAPAEQEFLAQTLVERLDEHIEKLDKYIGKVRAAFVKAAQQSEETAHDDDFTPAADSTSSSASPTTKVSGGPAEQGSRREAKSHVMIIEDDEDESEEEGEEVPIRKSGSTEEQRRVLGFTPIQEIEEDTSSAPHLDVLYEESEAEAAAVEAEADGGKSAARLEGQEKTLEITEEDMRMASILLNDLD